MRFPMEQWRKMMTTGCHVSFLRVLNGIYQQERLHPSLALRYISPALESNSPIRHIWISMELIRRLRTNLCVEIAAPDLQLK